MNPKVLKKLRDAGFFKEDKSQFFGGMPSEPHLETLVAACKDDFFGLRKNEKRWMAFHTPEKSVSGDTPSEAVALLWIKLYDK